MSARPCPHFPNNDHSNTVNAPRLTNKLPLHTRSAFSSTSAHFTIPEKPKSKHVKSLDHSFLRPNSVYSKHIYYKLVSSSHSPSRRVVKIDFNAGTPASQLKRDVELTLRPLPAEFLPLKITLDYDGPTDNLNARRKRNLQMFMDWADTLHSDYGMRICVDIAESLVDIFEQDSPLETDEDGEESNYSDSQMNTDDFPSMLSFSDSGLSQGGSLSMTSASDVDMEVEEGSSLLFSHNFTSRPEDSSDIKSDSPLPPDVGYSTDWVSCSISRGVSLNPISFPSDLHQAKSSPISQTLCSVGQDVASIIHSATHKNANLRTQTQFSPSSSQSPNQVALAMSPSWTTYTSSQDSSSVAPSMITSVDLSLKALFTPTVENINGSTVLALNWCLNFDVNQSLLPPEMRKKYIATDEHLGHSQSSKHEGPIHIIVHYDGEPSLLSDHHASTLQRFVNHILVANCHGPHPCSVTICDALNRPGETFPTCGPEALDDPLLTWATSPPKRFSWFGRYFRSFEAFITNLASATPHGGDDSAMDEDGPPKSRGLGGSLCLPDFRATNINDLFWVLKQCPDLKTLQMKITYCEPAVENPFGANESHDIEELYIKFGCPQDLEELFFLDDPETGLRTRYFPKLQKLSLMLSRWTKDTEKFLVGSVNDLEIEELQITCETTLQTKIHGVLMARDNWSYQMGTGNEEDMEMTFMRVFNKQP